MTTKIPTNVYDAAIIAFVEKILNAGDFTVETINESILVELMERRGTPLTIYKCMRDTVKDFEREREFQQEAKLRDKDPAWAWDMFGVEGDGLHVSMRAEWHKGDAREVLYYAQLLDSMGDEDAARSKGDLEGPKALATLIQGLRKDDSDE